MADPVVILRDPKFAVVPLQSADQASVRRALIQARTEADRAETAESGAEAAEAGTLGALAGVSLANATLNAATRVILAGLDRTLGIPALLMEGERWGVFKPVNGDLSSWVTLDTQQGHYVAYAEDPTGATGAWVRQSTNLDVHANHFGAKADWDGSIGTDNTIAIQAALDLLNARGGGTIHFGTGGYYHTGHFTVYAKTLIFGEGRFSTRLISDHVGSAGANAGETLRNGSCFVSAFPINSSNVAFIGIENICLQNLNSANVGAGYYDTCGTYLHLHNVRVLGFKYGIVLDQSELVDIDLCGLESQNDVGAGLWIVNGPTLNPSISSQFSNRISLKRSQINQGATTYGVLDDGGGVHCFEDNNFNGCSIQYRLAGVIPANIRGGEHESSANSIIYTTYLSSDGRGVGGGVLDVRGGFYTGGLHHVIENISGNVSIGDGMSVSSSIAAFVGLGNGFTSEIGSVTQFGSGDLTDGSQGTHHFDMFHGANLHEVPANSGAPYLADTEAAAVYRATGSGTGKVVTTIFDHGGLGGQVYTQCILRDAGTGYSDFAIRTRGPAGVAEAGRFNESGIKLPVATGVYIGGTKVLGTQVSAIAYPSGGTTVDNEARNAIDLLINAMRSHGLVAG